MTPISHYTTHAVAYATATREVDMASLYSRFLPHVPAGGRILDAGCGSGRDALAFRQQGYVVEAFDANPELAALASTHVGIPVRVMGFLQLGDDAGASFDDRFAGIWACASLLHVAEADQAQAWTRLWAWVATGGVVYASYKLGEGERVDEWGRPFTDATDLRLRSWLMPLPGVTQVRTWVSADQRRGQSQAWLNALVQRELCA